MNPNMNNALSNLTLYIFKEHMKTQKLILNVTLIKKQENHIFPTSR